MEKFKTAFTQTLKTKTLQGNNFHILYKLRSFGEEGARGKQTMIILFS